MTAFNYLQLEIDNRNVATLWLNRPERNNALNADFINELTTAFKQVSSDPKVRLLVIRSKGKHFCSGGDLKWMQESINLDLTGNLKDAQLLSELFYQLYHLPKPTLAVVQGAAFGGAVGLVACCDMAIGADNASFCLSEVRIGLIPATMSPFIIRCMGKRAALSYSLTAKRFNGKRATELGLLQQSCPAEELSTLTEKWITQLLQNSPAAQVASKQLFAEIGTAEITPELRRYTEEAIAKIRVSKEGQEGLHAFLEKRSPHWVKQ
ncbi:enoyl-CoA hydratase-related protein [Entomomonas asaccharolytica]|uniref:Enoyl-CoA hydratase/isomerase family protein n=1 Tax=Entomomonas asaccharolytica TaxID=2785331 RepID=A0A974NHK1_9GAMM|nr:enoyl-CoA hydratase-related protein [Entomomonas asaccharolytica]QQP86758.1 enoyl-CoA hydratase/isomerase family protein [Entomomonas asaccharolytica]